MATTTYTKTLSDTIKTTTTFEYTDTDTAFSIKIVSVRMDFSAGLKREYQWAPYISIARSDAEQGRYLYEWNPTYILPKGTKTKTITLNKTVTVTKSKTAAFHMVFDNSTCDFWSTDDQFVYFNNATYTPGVGLWTHYSISYAANGGTSTPGGQTKWYGEALSLRGAIAHNATSAGSYAVTLDGNGAANPAALSAARTTYWSFAGWKSSYNSGVYSAGASYPASANSNATMTAQWSTSTSTGTVKLPTHTRANYSFRHWNTKSDNTGSSITAGTNYQPPSPITLHAIWNRTVSYNGNGAQSGGVAAQTDSEWAEITVSSSNYVRPGYRFSTWNTQADGLGTNYAPGSKYLKNKPNMTLYAVWKRLPTASAPTAERCDANGRADPVGAYVNVSTTRATYDDVAGQQE